MLSPARTRDTSALAFGASNVDTMVKSFTSNLLGDIAGQAGSKGALKKLTEEISDQKRSAARPLLLRASRAINAGDHAGARQMALDALKKDEKNGFGWYILAMALEVGGEFSSSISAYEAALKLLPNHEELANDLGRLALRLNMLPQAEKLFRRHLETNPDAIEVVNNLGTCLRQMGRYEEAIEIVRPVIIEHPEAAMLWNTMGTIMGDMGDIANARVFCSEAIRVDPGFYKAHHNLANMTQLAGDSETSLAHADLALEGAKNPADQAMMRMSRFNALITLGRIAEGWEAYETRLDPHFAGATVFALSKQLWRPGDDIRGKTLLVMGEQGLGDEILFGTMLPDVLDDLGPDGKLLITVEHRLVKLFQDSFPQATVGLHKTGMIGGRATRFPHFEGGTPEFDMWVPMASLLRGYRTSYESFGSRTGVFKADPERMAHWRDMLDNHAPKGPKVGLLWKSASMGGARHRFYSPLEQWRPVLTTPGVSFVNVQYGDCTEDLAYFKKEMGVEVWDPPGIDLKQDLDGVAALCASCDLIIGFSNATLNIAAAVGAPNWLIMGLGSWPRMGLNDRYPWYPQTRLFGQEAFQDWDNTMGRIAAALHEWVGERQAA